MNIKAIEVMEVKNNHADSFYTTKYFVKLQLTFLLNN